MNKNDIEKIIKTRDYDFLRTESLSDTVDMKKIQDLLIAINEMMLKNG